MVIKMVEWLFLVEEEIMAGNKLEAIFGFLQRLGQEQPFD